MKQMSGLLKAGLLAISVATSGCTTTTEYVTLQPQCAPPKQPALPVIDRGELWDKLGDSEYRVLERYVNGLWSWADEQAAMLDVLCGE